MVMYQIRDKKLNIVSYATQGRFSRFLFSAVQSDEAGNPTEIIIKNGEMYVPEGYVPSTYVKPVALFRRDRTTLQEHYTPEDISYASLMLTGQALLLREGLPVNPLKEVQDAVQADEEIPRGFLGIKDGVLHYMWDTCDIYTMQLLCYDLGFSELMLMTFGKYAFFEDKNTGGYRMGFNPVTLAEALKLHQVTDPILVLDAGHGGAKPGAIASDGTEEEDITLDMALVVAQHLQENYVVQPVLTRKSDVDVALSTRTAHANAIKAAYFWSIHVNAHPSSQAHGFETLVAAKASPRSKSIAQNFHKEAAKVCGRYGLMDRGWKERADLWVLNQTNMPAMLTEVGFLSNPQDLTLLKDRAKLLTLYVELADIVARTLGLQRRVAPVQQPKFRVTLKSTYEYNEACKHADVITKMGLPAIVEKL